MPKSTTEQSSRDGRAVADPPASSVRRRLGRGLTSLLSAPVRVDIPRDDAPADAGGARPVVSAGGGASASVAAGDAKIQGELRMIALSAVRPNPYQPRKRFDEALLETLAASIREAGLMQPVVVRPRKGPVGVDAYELIAGERRWRAAERIGLARIPAVVRDVDAQTAAQWALIENLQREDLNAIERAEAFRRLADEFALTHQEIADRVGLDRTSVTNHLRLLELDEAARSAIAAGELSMGHGRALLSVANIQQRAALSRRAVAEAWSVRELERRAREAAGGVGGVGGVGGAERVGRAANGSAALPPHLDDLQRRLGEHLGAKVAIRPGRKKGAGRLVIEFFTLDEFEGLLERLAFDPS